MICKKCGNEFSDGLFCPQCGTKYEGFNENNEQHTFENKKNKKKKYYFLLFLTAGALLVLFVINLKSEDEKIKELKSQLSEEVTNDYIPGTYVTNDGKVFAIDVYDKDIFKIKPKLAKIFQGQTSTDCTIIFSDIGLEEKPAIFDVAEKTIELYYDDKIYKYKINNKTLKLTCPDDEKITFHKISDEYDANKIFDICKK